MIRRLLLPLLIALLVQPLRADIVDGPWFVLQTINTQSHSPSGAQTLDATADRFSFVFQVTKTGTLGKVRFCLGTTTVTAGATLRVSFQNVNTSTGFADDTDDQYRVTGVIDTADNTCILTGLITDDGTDTGAKRSVTVGDYVAAVIKYESFTAADTAQIRLSITNNPVGPLMFGNASNATNYLAYNLTGSYARDTKAAVLTLLYDDDSVAQLANATPASVISGGGAAFNSGSNPNVYGMHFSLPYPAKLVAAGCLVDYDQETDLVLYDSGGSTTLGRLYPGIRQGVGGNLPPLFFAPINLTANAEYVVAAVPTTTTPNVTFSYVTNFTAGETIAINGINDTMYLATAQNPTDVGDFTLTTTSVPFCGLVLAGFHDGTGTGSMNFVPVE